MLIGMTKISDFAASVSLKMKARIRGQDLRAGVGYDDSDSEEQVEVVITSYTSRKYWWMQG